MKKFLLLTTAVSTLFLCANAQAAGFHLREQSAAAQGNAYAGATAGAEDISYAYYNVAGITRHDGTNISVGAAYIAPKASASNVRWEDGSRDADVQNVVHAAVSPNFAVSHQVNDKLYVALSGNSPFGMITKYDEDWAGSDHGITSDLKSATITPMAAYKATDKFSLGAGLQVQYVWAHLTNTAHPLQQYGSDKKVHVTSDGHAWDLGYQLGAMYEFNESTRAGIGYRSEIKHKIKGKMKTSSSGVEAVDALLNQEIGVRLTTPAMLSLGVYHDINSRWAVMAEYQRVFWSSFKNLTFVSRDGNNNPKTPGYITQVKEKWRDTNFYSVGTSVKLDEQWKLRLGLAYDQGAVQLQHRTPRIPDSDRIWYTIGLGYDYNEHLNFNAAYTYIYAHKARLDTRYTNNNGKNVSAEYDNSIQAFMFGITYKF